MEPMNRRDCSKKAAAAFGWRKSIRKITTVGNITGNLIGNLIINLMYIKIKAIYTFI